MQNGIDNINTFATREEAEANLARRGEGEILDDSILSRAELEAMYAAKIVKDEEMEAAIDRRLASAGELSWVGGGKPETREEARAAIELLNRRYREAIESAPAERIERYRVCV